MSLALDYGNEPCSNENPEFSEDFLLETKNECNEEESQRVDLFEKDPSVQFLI